MGSDIARISFDSTRQYRSVVLQQGRVTLEADGNETSRITSEALRLETIDLVGPAATPDDGYKLGLDQSGNVAVLPGTMYLGGWRLVLDAPVELDNQPDWLNMPPKQAFGGPTLVALLATEQSVCAVEDEPLREVALGGPDSAARTRLMQHFLRLPVRGTTCDSAAKEVDTLLAEDGVTLDPKTFQLLSSARLLVGFVPPAGPPDPCDPPAQGGYLGADNQMVRVTVIDFNPQSRTGTLLWGWNNASFLYRATPSGPQAMQLAPIPVDAEHSPQQSQAIEVLLTQADLGDGNDVAALSALPGQVGVLTQAYDPDTNLMTLPAGFTLPSTNRPLFVRLWQALVPFTSGTPVALDAVSGLSVTITMTALPTHIAERPYWNFAVRPETPQRVYPQRYLDAPQPPTGPRQWLCDLAVVQIGDGFRLLDDCRQHWPGTGQGCCCGVTMGPTEVAAAGGLQAALDRLAGTGTPGGLTLRPGVYVLAAPLTLTQKHERLTLEGCDGVILQADPQQIQAFRGGAIRIQQATGIRLSGLVLELPVVPGTIGDIQVNVMNGLNAAASPHLTIEGCTFAFAPADKTLIAGGALAVRSDCTDLTVRGNRFVCSGNIAETRATFGVLITAGDNRVPLDDCEIGDNLFTGLGLPVGTLGPIGLLRCCDNRVRQCAGGFYFLAMASALTGRFAARTTPDTAVQQATGLPATPAMLASVAENVRQAIAQAGARRQPQARNPARPRRPVGASIDSILDALDQPAGSAELAGAARPALHFRNNDIELSAASRPSDNLSFVGLFVGMVGAQQPGAAAAPPPGHGAALIHGNRIGTPAFDVAAATITIFQAQAVVTANLFTQLLPTTPSVPCFTSTIIGGSFEVMGNVISPQATIAPARSPPPTNDWPFLNTIG